MKKYLPGLFGAFLPLLLVGYCWNESSGSPTIPRLVFSFQLLINGLILAVIARFATARSFSNITNFAAVTLLLPCLAVALTFLLPKVALVIGFCFKLVTGNWDYANQIYSVAYFLAENMVLPTVGCAIGLFILSWYFRSSNRGPQPAIVDTHTPK